MSVSVYVFVIWLQPVDHHITNMLQIDEGWCMDERDEDMCGDGSEPGGGGGDGGGVESEG